MSTQYGVKYDSHFNDKNMVDAKFMNGNVKCASDYFDLSIAIPDGDVLKMGRLPKGAVIVGAVLDTTDLDGSGGTIDVGWKYRDSDLSADDDADGILAAVDVTSAQSADQAEQANLVGRLYELLGEADIEAKVNLCDATSGRIKLSVFYTTNQ